MCIKEYMMFKRHDRIYAVTSQKSTEASKPSGKLQTCRRCALWKALPSGSFRVRTCTLEGYGTPRAVSQTESAPSPPQAACRGSSTPCRAAPGFSCPRGTSCGHRAARQAARGTSVPAIWLRAPDLLALLSPVLLVQLAAVMFAQIAAVLLQVVLVHLEAQRLCLKSPGVWAAGCAQMSEHY